MAENEVTFNIKATMNKRWVNHFCSMLKQMEHDGEIGHSEWISFYSDGDGDYGPKFEIDIPYKPVKPLHHIRDDVAFDAG